MYVRDTFHSASTAVNDDLHILGYYFLFHALYALYFAVVRNYFFKLLIIKQSPCPMVKGRMLK